MRNVYFFDVDGTITLPGGNTISDKTLKSLKKIKDKGDKLVLVTGRTLERTESLKKLELFDYYVVNCGSIIIDKHNRCVKEDHLSKEQVSEVVSYFNSIQGLEYVCVTKDKDFTTISEDKSNFLKQVTNEEKRKYPEVVSYEELMKFAEDGKITFFSAYGTPETLEILKNELIEKVEGFQYQKINDIACDVTYYTNNKGSAVYDYFEKMHEYYTFIAFGDSDNDISLFNVCDLSICMGNGTASAKFNANYVTKSVEEDGISYALENFDCFD